MTKITNEDRKHAHNFLIIVKRNAYGGNLMAAEGALARVIAEERDRVASRLGELLVDEDMTLINVVSRLESFIKELRGEDESTAVSVPEFENESTSLSASVLKSESMAARATDLQNESSESSAPIRENESEKGRVPSSKSEPSGHIASQQMSESTRETVTGHRNEPRSSSAPPL